MHYLQDPLADDVLTDALINQTANTQSAPSIGLSAYAAPVISNSHDDLQSLDNATEYNFGDNDDLLTVYTEDEESGSNLEYSKNFFDSQDSITNNDSDSVVTDNSNNSNNSKSNNNSNNDYDHRPLKFVISLLKKISKMQEKSIQLYSLMLSIGVPREMYCAILSFLNDWISDEHFGIYKYV